MVIKPGKKFKVRRGPGTPIVYAVVDYVVAEIDDYERLGVRVTATIIDPNDTSSRPDEQIDVGIFLFKMWVALAEAE